MKIDNSTITNTIQKSNTGNEDAKLKKACSDFESMLISQMLSKMREATPKTDLFGSGEEEGIFQNMMDQEIAQNIAKTDSMQIGEFLYKQLSENIKKG